MYPEHRGADKLLNVCVYFVCKDMSVYMCIIVDVWFVHIDVELF